MVKSQNILSELKINNDVEKEIAAACLTPSIFNFPPKGENSFLNKMNILIGRTVLNCGFKDISDQTGATIFELCDEIKKRFKTITFEQIELAFKNGWQKEYGDFMGLSNATYIGWIKGFLNSESTLKVKKAIQEAKNKPATNPEPTKEEQEYIVLQGVLLTFDTHKNGGTILDPGNYVYNFLEKKGFINLTIERKKEILNSVIAKIRLKTLENKNRTETIESALKKALDESLVKAESRREALREYFNTLIEMEVDIRGVLEN